MTTEGTFPHFGGGVSVWCDQLIRHMSDIRFHVLAIVPSPKQPRRFELAPNIDSCNPFPLWGTELPGPQEFHFSRTYARRLRTTRASIAADLLPALRKALDAILAPDGHPVELGEALARMADYFDGHDYALSMRSDQVWDTFRAACTSGLPSAAQPTLAECVDGMRWLVRYLSVVALPLPGVDLVHASMAGLAAVPGTLARIRAGTPFLLTEHGVYLRELYLSLARSSYSLWSRSFLFRLNEAIVRMNYHYADLATSLGPFNTRWQVRFGTPQWKLTEATNGVDPELFHPGGERPERPTVLTLARIFRLKGIDVLLRAASMVRESVPQVCFRILGEVADPAYHRECLKIVEQHGLAGNVEWGETRTPEKEYGRAHVFCLPSVSEGVPFTVLEAMLSKCPVVATDVGNVAQMVDDTALLVRPNSPGQLASALLQLLEGEGAADFRNHLAEAAYRRALRRFTLRAAMTPFRDLYGRLMSCESKFQPV